MELAEMKLVAENSRTLYEMRDALNCAIEQLSTVEGKRDAAKERGDRHMLTLRNNHAAAMRNHKEMKAELLQVKGERDRYREALEDIAYANTSATGMLARAALHPATEAK